MLSLGTTHRLREVYKDKLKISIKYYRNRTHILRVKNGASSLHSVIDPLENSGRGQVEPVEVIF